MPKLTEAQFGRITVRGPLSLGRAGNLVSHWLMQDLMRMDPLAGFDARGPARRLHASSATENQHPFLPSDCHRVRAPISFDA